MKSSVNVLILLVALFGTGICRAEATAARGAAALKSLTEAYVATLDKDLHLQSTFYTPSTHFRDPTSALFGPAWDITGGEQIIQFFKTASEDSGTLEVVYKITNMLVEGSLVVANITATVTSCGVGIGFPSKSFSGDIHMVMVLKFDGEKLKERTDYVGYSAAWDKMEAMKSTLGMHNDDVRCK
jgi:hypothetical protein